MTRSRPRSEKKSDDPARASIEEIDLPRNLEAIEGMGNLEDLGDEASPSPDFLASRSMTRVSAEKAQRYKEYLSQWRSLTRVDRVISAIADKAQLYTVSQGGLKFWREAFVGMSCAQLTHAIRFRLGGDPPDFELDYHTHVLKCELVTALPKGTKLGKRYDEYAENLNTKGETVLHSNNYDQDKAEYDSVIDDIKELIEVKMSKKYDEKYILVVDVLHAVYFETDVGVVRGLDRIARRALEKFDEVWIRQATNILRVSPYSSSMISSPWASGE